MARTQQWKRNASRQAEREHAAGVAVFPDENDVACICQGNDRDPVREFGDMVGFDDMPVIPDASVRAQAHEAVSHDLF